MALGLLTSSRSDPGASWNGFFRLSRGIGGGCGKWVLGEGTLPKHDLARDASAAMSLPNGLLDVSASLQIAVGGVDPSALAAVGPTVWVILV